MRQLVANLMIFKGGLLAEQPRLTASFILTILALFQHSSGKLAILELLVEYELWIKSYLRDRLVNLIGASLRVHLLLQVTSYGLSLIGLMEVLI